MITAGAVITVMGMSVKWLEHLRVAIRCTPRILGSYSTAGNARIFKYRQASGANSLGPNLALTEAHGKTPIEFHGAKIEVLVHLHTVSKADLVHRVVSWTC